MKEKMSLSQILSLSLMLFAMFFGAGNMIFPPALGSMAQSGYLWALLGFILTDAGIAILAIIAIVNVGESFDDLGNKVSKRFSIIFSFIIYLLIGPLFALPRCGSVSFEMGITPFLSSGASTMMPSLIYTAIFFGIALILSLYKNHLVDIIGKVLTPILLLSIAAIFIATLLKGGNSLQEAAPAYQNAPFFKGLIEGYLALDGPAGLVFAMVVIENVRSFHIKEKKNVIRYTAICGMIAAFFLSIVYFALSYVGAYSAAPGMFSNGSQLLNAVSYTLFGNWGRTILGVAVLLACLTTAIGLITCFSEFIHKQFPKISYRTTVIIVSIFSFIIANFGLNTLITITLPLLIILYPVTIVLVVTSFFDKHIKDRRRVYILGMSAAFIISFFTGMDEYHIHLGAIHDFIQSLPFYDLGIAWIIPSFIASMIGFLPIGKSSPKQPAT